MQKKYVFTIILILSVVGIIIGATVTTLGRSGILDGKDKVIHFIEFFFFGLILFYTLSLYSLKYYRTLGSAIGIGFALFSEWIQTYFPPRTYSEGDLAADLLGLLFGMIAIIAIGYIQHGRNLSKRK